MRPDEDIRTWSFWSALTPEEREWVARQTAVHRVPAGSLLLDEHSEPFGAMLVQKGRLCLYMIGSEGRAVLLHSIEEGESFLFGSPNWETERPLGLMMEADCDSLVLTLTADIINALLERNPQLMRQAYRRVCVTANQMLRSLQRVLFAGIPARVAQALLDLSARQNRPEVRITQERLAREASSSREVITRTLKGFAAWGIVRLGHGRIEVLDPARLRSLAEGRNETEG